MEHRLVALDCETNGTDIRQHHVTAVSLTFSDESNELYDFYYPETNQRFVDRLKLLIAEGYLFIMHFGKFDLGMIYHNFGVLIPRVYCTYTCELILTNGKKEKLGLDVLLHKYFGVQLVKDSVRTSFLNQTPLTPAQKHYVTEDTNYLIPLQHEQVRKLEVRNYDHSRQVWVNLTQIAMLENKVLPVIVRMEANGVVVDVERLKRYHKVWQRGIDMVIAQLDIELINLSYKFPNLMVNTIKQTIYSGREINGKKEIKSRTYNPPLVISDLFDGRVTDMNYSSNNHLMDLFRRCGIPVPVDSKTNKETVDEKNLKEYMKNNPESHIHRFITLILTLRERQNTMSKYGENFIQSLHEKDGEYYTYTSFRQMVNTGRMSSSAYKWKGHLPNEIIDTNYKLFDEEDSEVNEGKGNSGKYGLNLQNIPATNFRSIFKAPKGYVWLSIDYAGIEARLAAEVSQEPILIKSFTEGLDIHCYMSTAVYSVIFDTNLIVTADSKKWFEFKGIKFNHKNDLRKDSKNGLYGYFYGAKWARFYSIYQRFIDIALPVNNMFTTEHHRKELSKKVEKVYNEKLPVLTKFLKNVGKLAKETGYIISNKMGRIRYFNNSGYVEGEASNQPMQGTNADIIKIALINCQEYFDSLPLVDGKSVALLLIPVHDEINVAVHQDWIDIVKPKVESIMIQAGEYFVKTVPIEVESNVKKYWKH
jgi:DNA polymerase I-like protein with 3'-5' exonuclease and polymerase domains